MPKRNLAWILVIAMITLLMWQLPQTIAGRDAVYRAFGPLADAKNQIRRRFAVDVDDEKLGRVAVDAGIRAMVRELGDPHAAYLDPRQYERFKNRADGVFGGIGVDVEATKRGLEVLNCDPGTPAADADIRPGDIIERIDGTRVAQLSLVESEENLLHGPPGEEVKLVIIRPEDPGAEPRELVVRRAIIHREVVRGWSRDFQGRWQYFLDPRLDIAYLRLLKFTHDSPQQLDRAMDQLISAGVRGLILDLRDNTGGLLDSAREIADRFLDAGLIVRVAGRRTDDKQWSAMHEGTYPKVPLAILINATTASASEIVAGALRDHGRAVIIGERSYGKGSVQEVVELGRNAGAIKLTTAYYFLPSGHCIHKTPEAAEAGSWGVEPTVTVKMNEAAQANRRAAWRRAARTPTVPSETPSNAAGADEPPQLDPIALDLCSADRQLEMALEHLKKTIGILSKRRGKADPSRSSRMN